MRRITLKESSLRKWSWKDYVKYYFPKFDDRDCDFLLFEMTCFPFSAEHTIKQIFKLQQYYHKKGKFPKNATI